MTQRLPKPHLPPRWKHLSKAWAIFQPLSSQSTFSGRSIRSEANFRLRKYLGARTHGKAVGESAETAGVCRSSVSRYAIEAAVEGVQDKYGSLHPAGRRSRCTHAFVFTTANSVELFSLRPSGSPQGGSR